MEHQEILHRCFRCGYCKLPSNYVDINCPSYLMKRFETFSPGGRMWLLRAWLDGKIQAGDRLAEIMFSCTTCGNCVTHCAFPGFRDLLLDAFTAGRDELLEAGVTLPGVRKVLTSLQLHGNAYGKPAKKRSQWAEGIAEYFKDQEYLFITGDAGAYDPLGSGMAENTAKLLNLCGISFGVLEKGECSDGNDAFTMGEKALFDELAQKNIKTFKKNRVKKIITLSPHSFNALKNKYPLMGGDFQVFHYSQILAFALGNLAFEDKKQKINAVFHDPCYLGRHNGDYASARAVLRALPNVNLREMDRKEKNALCCGGGGGNFFTDVLGSGKGHPAPARIMEADEAGAEALVVACPQCYGMLEDALKTSGLEKKMRVVDLAGLVLENLKS